MKLLFFCPRWGQEHLPWNDFLAQVKQSGYDGVESGIPKTESEKDEMLTAIQKHRLFFIGQHWETVTAEFNQHHEEYQQRLERAASTAPLFINSQTGKDYYSFQENATLIETAARIAETSGIPVVHETHRGKFSFAAHIMRSYLERLPNLRITLDISHWCAVAETLLQDQRAAVAAAIYRTDHLHARIGNTQGAQVTDPRAPEYQEAADFHLQCWDEVVAAKANAGLEQFTITPEFGAPPYLALFPYTKQPIVNQWEVNVFIMEMLRKRYPDHQ